MLPTADRCENGNIWSEVEQCGVSYIVVRKLLLHIMHVDYIKEDIRNQNAICIFLDHMTPYLSQKMKVTLSVQNIKTSIFEKSAMS